MTETLLDIRFVLLCGLALGVCVGPSHLNPSSKCNHATHYVDTSCEEDKIHVPKYTELLSLSAYGRAYCTNDTQELSHMEAVPQPLGCL